MTETRQQPRAALGDESVETYEAEILQPVAFPEDERQRILRELSLKVRELEGVEMDKKEANAEFNQMINDLKGRISRLAREGRDGAREEAVACRFTKNFHSNEITAVRLDTNETATGYPRAMTGEELQRGMEWSDDGDEA